MTANLQNPIFTDETKAREWLEARVWPNGPICPHCGATDEDVTRLEGQKHRPGLFQCSQCREQFTVTVKTVFERSKVPLSKWLAALFMMTASKKGVSAHQIHRSLGISYKTAWFVCHRLREAMRQGGLLPPMGGSGKVIEADETMIGRRQGIGRKAAPKAAAGFGHKNVVMTLVERGGTARSFHIGGVRAEDIVPVIEQNIARESAMMTDEHRSYVEIGKEFASHETVTHSEDEYVRYGKDRVITTNTVEGFFSVFKRGMKGVYQHCSEKHLHRYLAEFDFRYNTRTALGYNDADRAAELAKGIKGKRLTYRRPLQVTQSYPYQA